MADREKFDAWLERVARIPQDAEDGERGPDGRYLECLGGPIDGMFASVAEGCFTLRGASLIVPAQLVLQATPGEPERLAHRYARDHHGAFVYVGVVRASEIPSC